tara:strand:- start:1069 stop:1299 length:231 start_codon:yes stop_codon:yes gene_type:complete
MVLSSFIKEISKESNNDLDIYLGVLMMYNNACIEADDNGGYVIALNGLQYDINGRCINNINSKKMSKDEILDFLFQ